MDIKFLNLKKHFPSLPQNDLRKIYRARCERLRMLMHKGITEDTVGHGALKACNLYCFMELIKEAIFCI